MKFLIQIILLGITSLILVSLPSFDDTLGQIYSMLVAFYRLRENFAIEYIMYLAIITLLVLGSIATGLFERKIGFRNIKFSILVAIALIATIIAAYLEYLNSIPVSIQLFTWIDSESLNIFSGFQFSTLVVSPITPVVVYPNAEASKSQIIKENKGKSGVYLIFFC
jgi:predicted neutral ceramidase superfamily lipid hydrolase